MNETPVTVIAGFSGAGKTSLCGYLADHAGGLRVAVAAAPPRAADVPAEAARVAAETPCDHLLVELPGTASPSAVAEAFAAARPGGLRLDATVTVVDAARFVPALTAAPPPGRGEAAGDDARRTAEVLVDQAEFADVLVLNRPGGVAPEGQAQVEAVLRLLNPRARLVPARHGQAPFGQVVGTGLFDLDATGAGAGWLRALRGPDHPPAVPGGPACFVCRARRPFHPGRFYLFMRMSWPGVLRSRGVFWLASHPESMWVWSQAGASRGYEAGGAWLAALPREAWAGEHIPEAEMARIWDPASGDRRTEIAFIGIGMSTEALQQGFDWCLMHDDELEAGPAGWEADPFVASVFV